MSSIAKSDFHAALNRLESMAKGQGATQLYHTSGDSAPGSHAGTSTMDYQDEHTDGIDDNGTDYSGVKKALAAKVEASRALTKAEVAIVKGSDPRPFIAEKVAKGESLTAAESWVIKGGYDKMKKEYDEKEMAYSVAKGADKPGTAGTPGEDKDATSVPDSHAGEAEQDEIEADAKKSLDSAIAQTQNLRKGLEMSPILAEFANAMGHALRGVESNVVKSVTAAITPVVARVAQVEQTIAKSINDQGQFNVGFAETLVGIGQHVAGTSDVSTQQATAPAYAPKSQLRAIQGGQQQGVAPVQKSFGPGGLPSGSESMAKSTVVGAMTELVKGGKLNSLDVCRYEMTGEINPQVQQMVLAHVQTLGQ